jgi:hypothetical protein
MPENMQGTYQTMDEIRKWVKMESPRKEIKNEKIE